MAMTFADAFAQAYGRGLQRRWQQEREEAERKRQNEGATKVFDMLNSMGRQQATADASSGLQDAISGFNAANPNKPDYSFQAPDLTQRPGGGHNPTNGSLASLAQSSFGASNPQSNSLISLMPKVEAPKYDDASMYGTMSKALGQGVDYSLAAPLIQNYYTRQKAEKLKNDFNGIVDNFMAQNPKATDKDAYLWALKQKNAGYGIDPDQFAALYKAKKLQAVNLGDRIEMVDETQPGSYQVNASPVQREQLDLQRRGQDLSYAASMAGIAARGGGGGTNASTLLSLYKDATETVIEPTGEFDANGRPIMTRRVKNPELAKRLEPYVNGLIPNMGNSGGGDGATVDFNQAINEITAALNKNSGAPSGQRWNKEQFSSYIQQKYGDWILPYVDLEGWFPSNNRPSGSSLSSDDYSNAWKMK